MIAAFVRRVMNDARDVIRPPALAPSVRLKESRMSEALARVRNDSVLVRPAKGPGRRIVRRLAGRACALPARVYLGAAFSALLAGIGVNALLLQRGRHPAPFFAATQPHAAHMPLNHPVPARAPAATEAAAAASWRNSAPSSPPAKFAAGADAPARPPDPIGELLRGGEAGGDQSRVIQAAQGALAKLGYPVRADGVEGAATEQALRDFERSRGLPATTELTPHLMKQLTAAARAAER